MKKMLFITAFGLFLAADGAVAGTTLSHPAMHVSFATGC
jgi:hypothetical protein